MKKTTTSGGSNTMRAGMIGASLAGLAAAYFFLGPKGKKHQRHAKAWAIKMKGDVVEKLEKARDMSEPIYNEIIDSVAAEYKKNKMKAGQDEINALAKDMKKHWKAMSKLAQSTKHGAVRVAKRVAKKAKTSKKRR